VTAPQAGWIGIWVLVGSSVVIVLELALAGFWSARLARRGRALAVALEQERGVIQADVARLRAAMEETRLLWAPYTRVLRYLRHPLVIALLGYYRRRWFARRI
jgi:hypothetical protein